MNLRLLDTFAIDSCHNNIHLTDEELLFKVKKLKDYNFEVFYSRLKDIRIIGNADYLAVFQVWGQI